MEAIDDTDLYGDLVSTHTGEGHGHLKAEVEELRHQLQTQGQQLEQVQAELDEANAESARLSQERETLVRNISCLFKTAQMEIQRKDAELRQLRDMQKRHQQAAVVPHNQI